MTNLEKIILQKPKGEKLPEIPSFVKHYLDLKDYNPQGNFFSLEIKEESRDSRTDGIAYLNELVIEHEGKKAYSTGMMQYRGAYNWEIDDHDLHLWNPAILKESKNEIVYGLKTGAGNIKIYQYNLKQNSPKLIEEFNIEEYEKAKARQEKIEKIIQDRSAWFDYVRLQQGHHWDPKCNHDDEAELDDKRIKILLAEHADRDYDAITDLYKFYIWVKDEGIGESEVYSTGLVHPPGEKFYYYGIGIKSAEFDKTKNIVKMKVGNKSQDWKREHLFKLEKGKEVKKNDKQNVFTNK